MGDKLQTRYTGPYEIIEILGRGVYRLKDIATGKDNKQSANATNLKLWIDQRSPSQSPSAVRTPVSSPITSPETLVLDPSSSSTNPPATTTDKMSTDCSLSVANLTEDNKSSITSGGWLNDVIIDKANSLVTKYISGDSAQTSVLAQGSGFDPANLEMVQVVYANNHWVAICCAGGEVMIANSLGDNVDPIVVTQVKQLFPQLVDGEGRMQITLAKCSQQTNGSDCGVFAIAFAFEWALKSTKTTLDINFDIAEMRPHLLHCLVDSVVEPFPRRRRSGRRLFKSQIKVMVI
jgi:hypothetical protein